MVERFAMTIKAMDLLINHWARIDTKQTECEDMIKEKWEALKSGYGVDKAIAIMQITDPELENRTWKIPVPDYDNDDLGYNQSSHLS
ncbi:hypothetical protein AnigIFM56816_006124 [Aspergillus niger]|nr:hypothetical protein AnigIFM56816_006124 [Aspergillus niger]